MTLDGHEVFTSCSIGIVLHTDAYDRPESLLRDADTAMYHAKAMGKSRFKVFNQKMHEQAHQLMEMEVELRRAIDQEELVLLYQPIASIAAWISDQAGRLQHGRIQWYLIYSFATLIFLLVFVTR